jgi:hypothetical protein
MGAPYRRAPQTCTFRAKHSVDGAVGMGRRVRLATGVAAMAAGALPFVLGQAPAAAATDEGEAELTFTVGGQPVTCRLFGSSSVLDDEGRRRARRTAIRSPGAPPTCSSTSATSTRAA